MRDWVEASCETDADIKNLAQCPMDPSQGQLSEVLKAFGPLFPRRSHCAVAFEA